MNTRPNVDQTTANSVVQESLGLTAEDLGMNRGEDAFDQGDDLGGDDLDTGDEDLGLSRGQRQNGREDDDEPAPQQRQQPRQQEDDLMLRPDQRQQQQDRIPPAAEVRTDGKGNLVDRKTGQIVARAGAEARMYQKLHRTTQAYGQLQASHTDTQNRLNRAVELGTQLFDKLKELQNQQGEVAPQKFGLSNAEAIEAMNFAKEAKVDPVGTIKKLLTRAAAGGIDLSSIGLAGGNFDPKSLMDLVRNQIDTAMNPLRERSQRETAQEQQQREANERAEETKRELNTFLSANPEAKEFLPIFAQVYAKPEYQHMSLGEVWSRIQLNLMRRQAQQPSNQRPANQQQQRRQPRVPNGRQTPPNNGRDSELAPVSMSYEDIVRGIL